MAKTKQTEEIKSDEPTFTVEDALPATPVAPKVGADEITLDPSQFQEVILGSAVAAPLPQTFERIDC